MFYCSCNREVDNKVQEVEARKDFASDDDDLPSLRDPNERDPSERGLTERDPLNHAIHMSEPRDKLLFDT